MIASNSGSTARAIKEVAKKKESDNLYDYSSSYNEAELKHFQGDEVEAQKLYKEALFKCNKFIDKVELHNRNWLNIREPLKVDYKNRETIKSKIK